MGEQILNECVHIAPQPGDAGSTLELEPLVYTELRVLARSWLSRESPGHTLCATELAHEAYLRLNDQDQAAWRSRTHFLSVAAIVIRRILVDHARARGAAKRGGGWKRIGLAEAELSGSRNGADPEPGGVDVLDLHEALVRLRRLSPRQERVVELKFFGGLENREIAEAMGISETVVKREWRFARAWLGLHLGGDRS
ncbi:MAG: ECF-type sigma factor [Phycisphaerales bacterium JB039]